MFFRRQKPASNTSAPTNGDAPKDEAAPPSLGALGQISMLMALEPRFMFDAAGVAAVADVADSADQAVDGGGFPGAGEGDGDGDGDGDASYDGDADGDAGEPAYRTFGITATFDEEDFNQSPEIHFTDPTFVRFEGQEDTPLSLSGITLFEPESDPLVLTLEVEHGKIYGVTVGGDAQIDLQASVAHEDGDGYTKLVLTGGANWLNNVLDNLMYVADQNWYGTDTLTIHAIESNEGKVELDARESVEIHVAEVNDAPVVAGLPQGAEFWSVNEDETLSFHDAEKDAPLFTVVDPDIGDEVTLTLSVGMGTLKYNGVDLDVLYESTPEIFADRNLAFEFDADARTYTLSGGVGDLNDFIAEMGYVGNKDWSGDDVLSITAEDSDGATTTWTAAIRISPVDDRPVWLDNDTTSIVAAEGGDKILTAEELNLFDVDTGNKQIIIRIVENPTHGVIQKLVNGKWIDLGVGSTFSYEDVVGDGTPGTGGKIQYHHLGGEVRDARELGSESDSFKIYVAEVANSAGAPIADGVITLDVSLQPVNDAPTLGATNATVYEGQHGAVIKFSISDSDQDLSVPHYVTITSLPVDGTLYYFDPDGDEGTGYVMKDGVKNPIEITAENMNSIVLSLAVIQNGGLTYDHKGDDGAFLTQPGYNEDTGPYPLGGTRPDGFGIAVVDDGGGTGVPCAPVAMTVTIGVLPSNDLPYFPDGMSPYEDADHDVAFDNVVGSVAVTDWNDDHTVNGDTILTPDMLKVLDNDSPDSCLTYTLVELPEDGHGKLYYRVQVTGVDEHGEPITSYYYREIREGDCFTQDDVNNGRIVYRHTGLSNVAGDYDFIDAFGFTVRDGSLSVVDDKGQVRLNAQGTGYQSFEGGVGEWITVDGKEQWTLTTVRLVVEVGTDCDGGEGTVPNVSIGEEVIGFEGDLRATVYEGGMVVLTGKDLNALIGYYEEDGTTFTPYYNQQGVLVEDMVTDPTLVYRIESVFGNGSLYLRELVADTDGELDENGYMAEEGQGGYKYVYNKLDLFDSFRQADVDAGLIFYQHNGSEAFSDSMTLTISNGRIEFGGETATELVFSIAVKHVNDTPSASGSFEVTEGPTAEQLASGEKGFESMGVVLDQSILRFSDADDGNVVDDYGKPNTLTFVIVGQPAAGGVFVFTGTDREDRSHWTEVTYVTEAEAHAGADWSAWENNADGDIIVLTMEQLLNKDIRYIQDGSEVYEDAIAIIVNDNKGVARGGEAATPVDNGNDDGVTVSGRHGSSLSEVQTIGVKIIPVNDAPVFDPGDEADELLTVPFGKEGSQRPSDFSDTELEGMLIGKQIDGKGQLLFDDADHDPDQIIYRIVENTRFGTIWLKVGDSWQALGAGSEFSQADVEAGRVCYIHNGTESHADSFVFYVTDKDKVADDSGSYLTDYDSADNRTYDIEIVRENAAPVIIRKGPNEVHYLAHPDGLDLSGKFSVDDPDYHAIDGSVTAGNPNGSGVGRDLMQLTLEAKVKDTDVLWGSFELKKDAAELGVTITTDSTGKLVLTGTREALNAALGNLMFLPVATKGGGVDDIDKEVTLYVNVNDLDNGALNPDSAKGLTATEQILTIMASPINSNPVTVNDGYTVVMSEDAAGVPLINPDNDKPFTFTDSDHFDRNVNVVVLSVTHGTLAITKGDLYEVGYSNDGKTITIKGTNTAINDALETLRYTPKANYSADPGADPADVLTVVYTDGDGHDWGTGHSGELFTTAKVNIVITPVNDAPDVAVPETPVIVGTDHGAEYAVKDLDGKFIRVDDIDITGDGYGVDYVKVVVTMWDKAAGTAIPNLDSGSLNLTGGAATVISNDGMRIEIEGTLDAVNAALETLTFQPPSQATENSTDVYLKVEVFDNNNGELIQTPVGQGADDDLVRLIFNKDNSTPEIVFDKDKADGIDGEGWPVFEIMEDDTDGIIFKDEIVIKIDDADAALMEILDISMKVTVKADNGVITLLGDTDGLDVTVEDDGTIVLVGSQKEINEALDGLKYVPNPDYYGTDTITITSDDQDATSVDGGGNKTDKLVIVVEVQPDNDMPEIACPAQVTVKEDGTHVFGPEPAKLITVSDVEIAEEQTADHITVNLTLTAGQGTISITGHDTVVTVNDAQSTSLTLEGTTAQVNAALAVLTYKPATDWNGAAALKVEAVDVEDGTSEKIISITVEAVNDAPEAKEVDGGRTVVLAGVDAIAEDPASDAQYNPQTVGDLFGKFFDDARDQNGGTSANSLAGVVVVGNGSGAATGSWQYYNGTTWLDIPANCSGTTALYLPAGTQIRFSPAENFNGESPTLTVRLVDDSVVDPTHNPVNLSTAIVANVNIDNPSAEAVTGANGTTRFSRDVVTLTQVVTAVNDNPVITAYDVAFDEDASYTFDVAGEKITFRDVEIARGETPDAVLTITLNLADQDWANVETMTIGDLTDVTKTVDPVTGEITLVGVVADLDAILETLTITPKTDWNGSLTLTLTAKDVEHGESDKTVTITVNPVNDAPVVKDGNTIILEPIAEDTPRTDDENWHLVSTLFNDRFQDDRDGIDGGSSVNNMAGVVVVGDTSGDTGTWEFSTDGGDTWSEFRLESEPELSDTNALFLANNALIRFIPAANYNSTTPGAVDPTLTVRLVDDSDYNAEHNPTDLTGQNGKVLTFTVAEIAAIKADDGTTRFSKDTLTVSQSVTAVNDAPSITAPDSVTMKEDGSYAFDPETSKLIKVSDVEIETGEEPDSLTVTLTFTAGEGTLFIDKVEVAGNVGETHTLTGTMAEINAKLATLTYKPATDWSGVASVKISVTDGDASPATTDHTVAITVQPVNDAPVVADDSPIALDPIAEDTPRTDDDNRHLVSDLFGGTRFQDERDDIGNSDANGMAGVVVVGDTSGATGNWEFSIDGGDNWETFPSGLSDGKALFLANNALIRFIPATNYNSTKPGAVAPTLTVRLVDNSAANADHNPTSLDNQNGKILDITDGGDYDIDDADGTTRFSKGTITVSQSVTAVNDAPVITAPTTVTMKEDGAYTFGPESSKLIKVSDVEITTGEVPDSLTVTLTFTAGQGTVSMGGDAIDTVGDTLILTGTETEVNAKLATLIFKPAADWSGNATLNIKVTDAQTGESDKTVTIVVNPVNDAPVVVDGGVVGDVSVVLDGAKAINEDPGDAGLRLDTVEDLFGEYFNDARDNVNGSGANGLAGVVVVGNACTDTVNVGTWKYSTDGLTWDDIPTDCADGTALYLPKGAKIRFEPAKDYNGTAPELTVRLVDNSAVDLNHNPLNLSNAVVEEVNVNLGGHDVTADDGTTRFSKNVITLTQVVTPVNDAPTISAPDGVTMREDGTFAFENGNVISVGDVDDDNLTVTLTFGAGQGSIIVAGAEVIGNAGGAHSFAGTTTEVNTMLAGLIYKPATDWNGDAALDIKVTDAEGEESDKTVIITVEAVNDAPVDIGVGEVAPSPLIPGTTEENLPHHEVEQLFKSRFDDSRDDKGASDADGFAGVVVVGNDTDAAHGVWKYSLDDGNTWTAVPADCADDRALYLPADALLRFVPEDDYRGDAPTLTVRLVDASGADADSNPIDLGDKAGTQINVGEGGFDVDAADGTTRFGKDTVVLRQAVATEPGVYGPDDIVMSEDGRFAFIGADDIEIFDHDIDNGGLDQMKVTVTVNYGSFEIDGENPAMTHTFEGTLDQVNAILKSLVYVPDGDWNGDAVLTVTAVDEHGLTFEHKVDIAVEPVNDAPVATEIDGRREAVIGGGDAIDEDSDDTGLRSTDTVGSLFGGYFNDARDNVDGGSNSNGLAGVAVVGNAVTDAETQGVWKYSVDGANWSEIPTGCADGNALYLPKDVFIRFEPAENFNGNAPKLTVRLVDGSDPDSTHNPVDLSDQIATDVDVNDGGHDVDLADGTTRFSKDVVTLTQVVTPVNDAPTISAPGSVTMNEDGTYTFGDDPEKLITVNDVDVRRGEGDSVTVVVSVDNGSIAIDGETTDQDGSITLTGSLDDINAALGDLTYTPDADWNGEAILSVKVTDSKNEVATEEVTIAVEAINDAPVVKDGENVGDVSVVLDGDKAINEDPGDAGLKAHTVESLFGDYFNDARDNVDGGSNSNALAGVAVTGNACTDADTVGKWTYSIDNGGTWADIPTSHEPNTALYLPADALIRFEPAPNYNGAAPALTVRLVDDSAVDSTRNPVDLTDKEGTQINVADVDGTTRFSKDVVTLTQVVTPVNDAPTISAPDGVTMSEDGTYTFGDDPEKLITVNDVDVRRGEGDSVTVVVSVDNGSIAIDGKVANPDGSITLTGSLDDINAALGDLTYTPDADWNGDATLTVEITDSEDVSASKEVIITVDPVNDLPVISAPDAVALNEDGSYTFNDPAAPITVDDVEIGTGETGDSIKVIVSVGDGFLSLGGQEGVITLEGSRAEIAAALKNLTYTPAKDWSGNTVLTVKAVDAQGGEAIHEIALTVHPVNDAPVVEGDADIVLDGDKAIAEDTGKDDVPVHSVNDLFGGLFQDRRDDIGESNANAMAGVVVVGNGAGECGVWEYSLDGSNWQEIPADCSDSNALFLDAGAQLRFVPNANYNQNVPGALPTLSVRLVDSSATTEYNPAHPASGGRGGVGAPVNDADGVTRYSRDTIAITQIVTPENNPPVVNGPGAVELNEDGSYAFNDPAALITVDDVEIGTGETGDSLEVILSVGDGAISIAGHDGVKTVNPDGSITLTGSRGDIAAALEDLTYTPGKDWNGDTVLTVKAIDAQGGESSRAIGITVHPVNDAPAVDGDADIVLDGDKAVAEDTGRDDVPVHSVTDLFGGLFNDSRDGVALGSDSNAMAGVVVVGNGAGECGVWEYSLDGSNWQEIPADCSDSNALFLDAGAQLRFVPNANYNQNVPGALPTLSVRLVDDSAATDGNPAHPAAGRPGDVGASVNDADGVTRYSRDTITITQIVTPENNPPVVNGPGAVELNEDGSYTFNNPSTPITVDDMEIGTGETGDSIKIVLSVGNGSLSIAGHDSLKTVNQDGGITLEGSRDDIAAALKDLTYTPAPDWNGDTVLTVEAVDRHGGRASHDIAVTVHPVNDAPVIGYTGDGASSGDRLAVEEDVSFAFTGPNRIVFSDVDVDENGTGTVTVTLGVEHGKLILDVTAGVVGYPQGGDSIFTLTGSLADVNAAIASMKYLGDRDYNGTDQLAIHIRDHGNTGSGGELEAETVIYLDVGPMPDDPVANDDFGAIELSRDRNGQIGGNVLDNDHDIDGAALAVVNPGSLTGRYGALTVNADGSYTYVVDPRNADVSRLLPGDTLVDEIVYEMRDGNGGAHQNAVLRIEITTEFVPEQPNTDNGERPPANDDPVTPPVAPAEIEGGTPVYDSVSMPGGGASTDSSSGGTPGAAGNQPGVVPEIPTDNDFIYNLDSLVISTEITLHTAPDNRNVYINYQQECHLPELMFIHSNPSEQLFHEAVLEDGSPLPAWIVFDAERKVLLVTPPADAEGLTTVVILVRDSQGNYSRTEVLIKVRRPEEYLDDNGYRDPNHMYLLASESTDGESSSAAGSLSTEGLEDETGEDEPGDDEAREQIEEETARLIQLLLDDSAETGVSGPRPAGAFAASLGRAGNTGLWLDSLELVDSSDKA